MQRREDLKLPRERGTCLRPAPPRENYRWQTCPVGATNCRWVGPHTATLPHVHTCHWLCMSLRKIQRDVHNFAKTRDNFTSTAVGERGVVHALVNPKKSNQTSSCNFFYEHCKDQERECSNWVSITKFTSHWNTGKVLQEHCLSQQIGNLHYHCFKAPRTHNIYCIGNYWRLLSRLTPLLLTRPFAAQRQSGFGGGERTKSAGECGEPEPGRQRGCEMRWCRLVDAAPPRQDPVHPNQWLAYRKAPRRSSLFPNICTKQFDG